MNSAVLLAIFVILLIYSWIEPHPGVAMRAAFVASLTFWAFVGSLFL